MSRIVTGRLAPITADKLRFPKPLELHVPVLVDVFKPEIVNHDPIRVSEETRQRGLAFAREVIGRMREMSHSKEASDLLCLAYAALHGDTVERQHKRGTDV